MNAVDTNVLVYAVDATEPTKQARATAILGELSQRDEQLVVPWQTAVEFLACLRRWENESRITRDDTHAYLIDFLAVPPIVFPSIAALDISLDLSSRYSLSHWDSMLLAACIETGVDTLYTEDLDAGTTYDSVQVVNPFV
ncbi:MAG: nucleic-acid-binding protein, contains PIN domain protein [Planctomycetaceae bacterium]|nr:nucleic-acid-binding protein, contains PIN domain protein [Planctomycetaceae bacterium]